MRDLSQEPAAWEVRLRALTRWLDRWRAVWSPRPFMEQPLAWEQELPALSAWLRRLGQEEVEAGERVLTSLPGLPRRLRAWQDQADALSALPALVQRRPAHRPRGVPARKAAQVAALLEAAGDLELPAPVDWCAGKGHLARTLSRQRGAPVLALEKEARLCAEGQALAEREGLPVRFRVADVRDGPGIADAGSLLALHACGDLSQRALDLAETTGMRGLVLAPCCFHRLDEGRYRPLSRLGQSLDLCLSADELRLPGHQEVVASPRIRRLRRRELEYRAAMSWLLGQRGPRLYRLGRARPAWLTHGPEAFMAAMARKQGIEPPDGDLQAALRWGRAWVRRGRALGLARLPFRRPLELWVELDRALFLAERGWSVRLGRFCPRDLSPRNVVILGQRE